MIIAMRPVTTSAVANDKDANSLTEKNACVIVVGLNEHVRFLCPCSCSCLWQAKAVD